MMLKRDRGQAFAVTVIFLTVMVGMTAAVLDVGSWYRADRALQATADAAALAGAQALPEDETSAEALAKEYVEKNGGNLSALDISFSSKATQSDTITVEAERPAPGFFARIFGVDSVTVGARATARAGGISEAKYVAPITVNEKHPMLTGCTPPPCAGPGYPTEIELLNLHKPGSQDAAGSFGLIDLRSNGGGNPGASEMASWMEKGFGEYMKIGDYDAAPSTNFNNSQFKGALDLRLGTELLFPVYRKLTGPGTNAKFEIIAWVGFVPTKFTGSGDQGKVFGYFTEVIWEGVLLSSGPPAFGVKTVSLVE
jgi:hypothetical protein